MRVRLRVRVRVRVRMRMRDKPLALAVVVGSALAIVELCKTTRTNPSGDANFFNSTLESAC